MPPLSLAPAYGTNVADTWRQLPSMADRIFKGGNPAEIPVGVVTKRELVLNLKTAQQIGLTIPPDVLKKADKVIQ